jgi:hypothetical protein
MISETVRFIFRDFPFVMLVLALIIAAVTKRGAMQSDIFINCSPQEISRRGMRECRSTRTLFARSSPSSYFCLRSGDFPTRQRA